MLIRFIRAAPPSIVVAIGVMLTGLSAAQRLFLSTPVGLLVLALAAYLLIEPVAGVKPFTFGELVLWVDSLDTDASSIFWTSLLTFLGIFGGLSTGAWILRAQQRDRLRERAASEVGEVLTRVKSCVTEIHTEADGVLHCLEELREADDGAEKEYWAKTLQETYALIRSEAARLMALRQELGFAFDLHHHVFDSEYLLTGIQETINKAISKVIGSCRFVVPAIDPAADNERAFLIERGEWDKCRSLERTCRDFGPVIYGLLIPLRAVATSSSFPTTFTRWARDTLALRKNHRGISHFRRSLRKLQKEDE